MNSTKLSLQKKIEKVLLAASLVCSLAWVYPALLADRISLPTALLIALGLWPIVSICFVMVIRLGIRFDKALEKETVFGPALWKSLLQGALLPGLVLGLVASTQIATSYGPAERLNPICQFIFTLGPYHYAGASILFVCFSLGPMVKFVRRRKHGWPATGFDIKKAEAIGSP